MIRFFVGFMIALGAVGGIETSIGDADLALACGLGALGLMIMWSGVRNLNSVKTQ
jgi:hypothetical protein